MTDKLTDNEIIKALEICASGTCEGCKGGHGYDCVPLDMETILSLINRQKAEVERLNKANTSVVEHLKKSRRQLKTARAEAIKEFAERLKAEFDQYGATHDCYAVVDNVAKGMGVDTSE